MKYVDVVENAYYHWQQMLIKERHSQSPQDIVKRVVELTGGRFDPTNIHDTIRIITQENAF